MSYTAEGHREMEAKVFQLVLQNNALRAELAYVRLVTEPNAAKLRAAETAIARAVVALTSTREDFPTDSLRIQRTLKILRALDGGTE